MIPKLLSAFIFAVSIPFAITASEPVEVPQSHISKGTHWEGKRVGILGDSMSDPKVRATKTRFYDYLETLLGIEALPYARNGAKFAELIPLAQKMFDEQGDGLDALFVWCGTNDYNASKPIGEFFSESTEKVIVNGVMEERKKRSHIMTDSTFCGSINLVMTYLKNHYPESQIVLFTPIHRGFAQFGADNIQPDESYANGVDCYIDDYAEVVRKAGEIWSVPVIDFNKDSGLYPLSDKYNRYFANPKTDLLHPDENGHYRLARTAQFKLLALPSTFLDY